MITTATDKPFTKYIDADLYNLMAQRINMQVSKHRWQYLKKDIVYLNTDDALELSKWSIPATYDGVLFKMNDENT